MIAPVSDADTEINNSCSRRKASSNGSQSSNKLCHASEIAACISATAVPCAAVAEQEEPILPN